MDDLQLMRYAKHILLDEMGIDVQLRLLSARVLLIGAGGLGGSAALYLAAAGIGTLVIADNDVVELSNLQRQVIYNESAIGDSKVLAAKRALNLLNREVEVIATQIKLEGDELQLAIEKADLVLDCTDNFSARYAINRACFLVGVPLVAGAATGFNGHVYAFSPKINLSPCYNCLFKEEGTLVEEERCATTGIFGPVAGLVGVLQASEALKILGEFGFPLIGRFLTIDALHGSIREPRLKRDPACRVCGHRPMEPNS